MKTLLESTYINYYTYLVRIARLYVGSKAEAEDIVQDVFMHVWIKLNLNKSSQPIDIENVNYLVIAINVHLNIIDFQLYTI